MQAIYLNEYGVYSTILPAILKRLTGYYGEDESKLVGEYEKFVLNKRYNFGEEHAPYSLPESDLRYSPIQLFREKLEKSRMGFCKAICVHPAVELKVEAGRTDIIPGSIVLALRDISLPVVDIEELQYRQMEYVHGG